MKLVIAITQDEDTNNLITRFMEEGIRVTKLASTGGFLKSGNTTLLMGIEEEKLDHLMKIIEEVCKSREVITTAPTMPIVDESFIQNSYNIKVGGATVFVLDIDRYVRI